MSAVSGIEIQTTSWWFGPLKHVSQSIGTMFPNIWENKIHVPNHQPDNQRLRNEEPNIPMLHLFAGSRGDRNDLLAGSAGSAGSGKGRYKVPLRVKVNSHTSVAPAVGLL